MKKMKYNLKDMIADTEKDEAITKPVYKIISQDAISEMMKKGKNPAKEANQNGS